MDAATPQFFAIFTVDKKKVKDGNAPIFYAEDEEVMEKQASWFALMNNAVPHNLHNGVIVLVNNSPIVVKAP